jgi:L-alanine-DL-glutamate epimerase-like enolase superfamily enzyme
MKIVGVKVIPFKVRRQDFANAEVIPEHDVIQTLTKITTDDGAEGYYLGGWGHGDRDGLPPQQRAFVESIGNSLLVGQDPFDREKFWQWMWVGKTPENIMGVIDMALWDLVGRVAGLPVYKLLGGYRDKVLAYASTYPNMGSPQDYADHALACRRRGYKAYKIHPYYFWNPNTKRSVPGRPSFVKEDIEVCRAVSEAVGDDMLLMFDPWGTYNTYEDALLIGRELERLGFYWYEHPLNEYRVETYVKLCKELDIEIVSPELAEGNLYTRADWIVRGASDISRTDVLRGGLTPCKKTVGICEAFGVKCEIHMSGFANLQLLAATSEDTCEFYERGLEAPGMDYDLPQPCLEEICDPLDHDGYVHVPQGAGLGYKIRWDYIAENETK